MITAIVVAVVSGIVTLGTTVAKVRNRRFEKRDALRAKKGK